MQNAIHGQPHCGRVCFLPFMVKTRQVMVGTRAYQLRGLLNLNQHPGCCAPPLPDAPPPPLVEPDAGTLFVSEGDNGTLHMSSALWPLFGVLWPSGLALARHVDTLSLAGLRVLEVGCGLALAGMVAHRQGALVTVSDHHPMVPVFLAHNAQLNGLAPVACLTLDWHTGGPAEATYDLIMASDVLYEPGQDEALASFLMQRVRPGATVLLVDPGRGHYRRLGQRLAALGFQRAETRCELPGDPSGRRGRVLTFRRPAA